MKIIRSFLYAFTGISRAIQKERNMKIHALAGILSLTLGLGLKMDTSDLVIILLLNAMVLGAEMFNTCIEEICNILRDKFGLSYEGSRDIRDIAAGAVLVQAIVAGVIGVILVVKYI